MNSLSLAKMEKVKQFKGDLIKKYAGNLPREGYVDDDQEHNYRDLAVDD